MINWNKIKTHAPGKAIITAVIYFAHLMFFQAIMAMPKDETVWPIKDFFSKKSDNKISNADYWLLLIKHNIEKEHANAGHALEPGLPSTPLLFVNLPLPVRVQGLLPSPHLSSAIFKRYCLFQVFRI